jgi:hypothetical protein
MSFFNIFLLQSYKETSMMLLNYGQSSTPTDLVTISEGASSPFVPVSEPRLNSDPDTIPPPIDAYLANT